MRWIPVSERLPEESITVLGTTEFDDLYKTELYDDCGEKKWYANGNFDVPIIAWMPLPEPYKEDKYMDNTKVGWDEYVDIKDALLNIFEAGYTKEMILTVLEQIEDEEIYLSQSANNKQKMDHLEALKLAKTEQGGM